MKRSILICSIFLSSFLGFSQSGGDLDENFGSQGFSFFNMEPDSSESLYDVLALENGKILNIGYILQSNQYDILITRLNANGSPDLNFGNGGYVTHDLGNNIDRAFSAVELFDGKIVVVGYSSSGNITDGFIMRLNADGSLDKSFGEGSKGYTLYNGGDNKSCSPNKVFQYGSSFLVGARTTKNGSSDYSVYKFTQGGVLDQSFALNGAAILSAHPSDQPISMAVSSQGKIAVCGYSWNNGVRVGTVIQLKTDGYPDKSFSKNGITEVNFGSDENTVSDVVYDQNDQVIAVGFEGVAPDIDGYVLRYKLDGTPDSTFGTNGFIQSDIGTTTAVFTNSVELLEDNSILACGYLHQNSNYQIYALALTKDGKPHPKFGTGGDVNYDIPIKLGALFSVRASAIQENGDIILAGHYWPTGQGLNHQYACRLIGPDLSPSTSIMDFNEKVDLYPNPASESFQIDLPNSGFEVVNMYNVMGSLIREWKNGETEFHLDGIPAGTYFIYAQGKEKTYSAKLLIQR